MVFVAQKGPSFSSTLGGAGDLRVASFQGLTLPSLRALLLDFLMKLKNDHRRQIQSQKIHSVISGNCPSIRKQGLLMESDFVQYINNT